MHGRSPRIHCLIQVGIAFGLAWLGLAGFIGLLGRPAVALAAPPERPLLQAGSWVLTNVTYLGEVHDVNVYQPAGYPTATPYPVVYILHGWGQEPEMWQRADLEGQADLYGIVVIAVEGDDNDIEPSWYSRQTNLPYPAGSDWPVSFYEWFFKGAMPWVEANYSARTDPGGRAIVGFSMGGKGAMSLAGHRPDLFTAAAEFGGVMDLRDYSVDFEILDVYGPLNGNELVYAADSPIELAPNFKGLSITLLHGGDDTYVHYQQSRNMGQAFDNLGYSHLWEEISGLGHDISTYEITRTFQRFDAAFDGTYLPPTAWRYRFANDTSRQVYQTFITKTNPLTWTELISVMVSGFDIVSGDAFSLTTAPLYTPLAPYTVTIINLQEGSSTNTLVVANGAGRLSFNLAAGSHRLTIVPANLSKRYYLPIISKLS